MTTDLHTVKVPKVHKNGAHCIHFRYAVYVVHAVSGGQGRVGGLNVNWSGR